MTATGAEAEAKTGEEAGATTWTVAGTATGTEDKEATVETTGLATGASLAS